MTKNDRLPLRGPCGVAAAAAVLLFASCGTRAPDSGAQAPPGSVEAAAQPTVVTEEAAVMAMADEINVSAEFRPYQEIEVMAKVSGYVREIHFDVGDHVTEGDLLAVLEAPEMLDDLTRSNASVERGLAEVKRAREDIRRAETAHEIAHLNFTRLQSVAKSRPGLVAQHEIDTAQNRDLVAESQISSARDALASAEQTVKIQQAEAAKSQTLYNYARVVAPFTGTITRRYVDTGAMVQAGTASQARPIARLSQTGTLRLILPIPESVIPRLRVGTPVEVRVGSLNRTFRGRVARSTGRIVSATRTMETEVDVPNPTGELVPGMYADARLKLEERRVLSVPLTAVDTTGDQSTVMVVRSNGTVERRQIVAGLETGDRLEVLSGLADGDLVVVSGRGQLEQGQHVAVRKAGAQL
ncbi:MAG: efflux RND transporter periplasmic adaptor subunit [Bryobacteraceae bacterium]